MIYRLAANGVLIVHLAFVLFVVLGAALAVRWPRILGFHIAAVAWGVFIEFSGAICPLTPLEVHLRQLGGAAGYQGGFIEHYVMTLLYPSGLTRKMQIGLGSLALLANALAYTYFFLRRKQRVRAQRAHHDGTGQGSG
jgi:hypothetical protein